MILLKLNTDFITFGFKYPINAYINKYFFKLRLIAVMKRMF